MPKKIKKIKIVKTKNSKSNNSKRKHSKRKHSKRKHSKRKHSKSNNSIDELSLEDKSLLDFKKSKSFSVATTLSEYKSKSHIGEIYDYKPLHDKINNICINKMISKELSLNKKNSKEICECLFDKNKNLSIIELESRIKQKKDTPSSNCITLLDKFTKKIKKSKKSSKSTKK
jgi:hypothetical protein